jgi:hypothetical protein
MAFTIIVFFSGVNFVHNIVLFYFQQKEDDYIGEEYNTPGRDEKRIQNFDWKT